MLQSEVSRDARLALTDVILKAKALKDLSFAQLTEGDEPQPRFCHRRAAWPASASKGGRTGGGHSPGS